MSLNQVLNQNEQAAIKLFIEANLKVVAIKAELHRAEVEALSSASDLNNVYFADDSNLPSSLIVNYNGGYYYVEIDTDGGSGHRVRPVPGLLE